MSSGPFYREDDIGGVQKIVDDRTPRTEAQGTVIVVDPVTVWAQINGSSNAVAVDVMNGIVVKPNDKVALRRLPGSQRWSVYAVQMANGTAGNNNSSPSSSGGSVPIAAPGTPVITPTYGALVIFWTPPNSTADSLFELELADTASGTGAVIYKVSGSTYIHSGSTIKYARVRGLGANFTRSGWTAQASGTPINFLETLQDDVAAMLVQGDNITLTYNDTAGTITFDAAAPSITIEEDDLSPSVTPITRIIVPDGSLVDDGGGVVRLTFPTNAEISTIKKTIETRTVIYDETLSVDGPFDITGISSGYDRLEFVANLRTINAGSSVEELFMWFNNDTTHTNYWYQQLYGAAAGGAGGGAANSNNLGHVFQGGTYTASPLPMRGHIDRYSQTDLQKSVLAESLTYGFYLMFRHLQWLNTSAIDRITLGSSVSGNNFKAGSRFQLIGIKTEQVVTSVNGDLTSLVREYETDFNYATSGPLALRTVGVDEKVVRCKIIIDTVFDASTTLHVGEMGGTSRLMSVTENDPFSLGLNVTEPEYIYAGGEIINLYITTTATSGAGRVCLVIKG